MSFAPDLLIDICRGTTGDGDHRPLIASENPCNQHDLANMVTSMCE